MLNKIFKKKKLDHINLLELKPQQLYPYETLEDGKIVVLVPKFENKIAKMLMPKVSKANFRVKLDMLGSFVWKNCNGETTVNDIAEMMKAQFGDSVEPVYERVNKFIMHLYKDNLINLDKNK